MDIPWEAVDNLAGPTMSKQTAKSSFDSPTMVAQQ
jgi:hypothetical protein